MINKQRVRPLNNISYHQGPIIYWMARDQRVHDNWALLYAQELAHSFKQPFAVVFCVTPTFLDATWRQYSFMIDGLQEVEEELKKYHIPFFALSGKPEEEIPHVITQQKIGMLISDFSPLRIARQVREKIIAKITIPFHEVDAHNIVPCWVASPKQEYAARTFRPKIHRLLPTFLTPFDVVYAQHIKWKEKIPEHNWQEIISSLQINFEIKPTAQFKAGEQAAHAELNSFLRTRFAGYAERRNNPTLDGQSNLSPYLHFGNICAQTVALAAQKVAAPHNDKASFLEELIVRKELSDNYCFYNKQYDSLEHIASWAHTTLSKHSKDKREYIYTQKQFELAQTHDPLWNAAQLEMVQMGKMHGYMRMYWAKKILEWTSSPAHAMKIAIYLNDTYELDGRDPNGYVGIAWSIGGVHDRAWAERPIFGKIRYMNYAGCKSKFDVASYINMYQ